MRLLLVGFDAPWITTGYASTLRSIGKELVKRGHEVFSISGNFVFDTDGPILHDGIVVLSNKGCDLYPGKDMFLRHYHDIKPDFVLAHNDFYRLSYLSEVDPKILEKTLVWLPIEDTEGFMDLDKLRALKNVAFTTKYGVALYKNLLVNQRVFQINHQVGADFSQSDSAFLENVDKLKNKFVVLRIDRNQERKKWRATFESFQSFIKKHYISDAILIAKTRRQDLASKENLGQIVKELGIEENVHFIEDDLSVTQLRALYDVANIFFTTTGSEGFGLSIGEAMVCGKPIVCTGCSPLFDVVGDGAGSFIKVKGKVFDGSYNIHHNMVDTDAAADLLKEYYDDWKTGGRRLAAEGTRAKVNSNRYKVDRVVDEFERVFAEMEKPHERLLVAIATKNRPAPLTVLLESVLLQTYKNFDVFILDNSDDESMISNNAFMKQMELLRSYGHNAAIWRNDRQNAPDTHQKILEMGKAGGYKFIFKLDDDCVLEENVFEELMGTMQSSPSVGAVGCPILDPRPKTSFVMPPDYPAQTLENIYHNRQWTWDKGMALSDVEHLHSSFIYRTEALDQVGGFPKGLSKVAFREETLTTYPMFLKGWKLYYNPRCIMWHMKADHGGCRDSQIDDLYAADDIEFQKRIREMKDANNE